jgi:hypothetical protein
MEAFYAAMSAAGYKNSTIKQYKAELASANVSLETETVDLTNDTHGTLYRAFNVFQSWRDPNAIMHGPRGPNEKKTLLKPWCLSSKNYRMIVIVYYLVKEKGYAVDTAITYSYYQLKGINDKNKHSARAEKALKDFECPLIEDYEIAKHTYNLILNRRSA